MTAPILEVRELEKSFGSLMACRDISMQLWPGEVLGVVGESGSGKSTLLRCLAGQLDADRGEVIWRGGELPLDMLQVSEATKRRIIRREWGFVNQNPRDGLRMEVSAGANIAEPLMVNDVRHYGKLRQQAKRWLHEVEIDPDRADEYPRQFSGGMQQRLQIARNLATGPRLLLMDEPTGGLDVSVQARLLDLLRRLVSQLELSAIVVTHDLGVARLLADRLVVMRHGRIVETGLTDQVLDDPQDEYTQLLVASVVAP